MVPVKQCSGLSAWREPAGMFMFQLKVVFNHTLSCLTARSTAWPLFTSPNFRPALYEQSEQLREDPRGQFHRSSSSSNTENWTKGGIMLEREILMFDWVNQNR